MGKRGKMKTVNKWYHADKPMEISMDELKNIQTYEEGQYVASKKADGWRALIDYSNEVVVPYSSRAKNNDGPTIHPVSDEVQESLNQFFVENNLPDGSRIDAEWCARRKAAQSEKSSLADGKEQIIVFGILFYGEEYLGTKPESDRWNIIKNLKYNENVILVENTESDYIKFFEESKDDYKYEGIVLKDKDSFLVGNLDRIAVNPLWLKVKWRSGDDGLTIQ